MIDEAHQVPHIGDTLKLIADIIKDLQIIATGSLAFELSNKNNEPLTGRKFEFSMALRKSRDLWKGRRIIYRLYPDTVNNPGNEQEYLLELTNSYLFEDILAFQNIRNPEILNRLLTGLAFQLGREVSYNELSQLIGADIRNSRKVY
jgi:predicted AAA+ superfamily ATPase